MDRDDMIKFLDRAVERFPDDFKTSACIYCNVLPEPLSMTLTFEPGIAKFSVFRWATDGWIWLNHSGMQYAVCTACVKAKGMTIPARR